MQGVGGGRSRLCGLTADHVGEPVSLLPGGQLLSRTVELSKLQDFSPLSVSEENYCLELFRDKLS